MPTARAVRLWEGRSRYHEALLERPVVRSHGDYSLGNLVGYAADVVALDWATFVGSPWASTWPTWALARARTLGPHIWPQPAVGP